VLCHKWKTFSHHHNSKTTTSQKQSVIITDAKYSIAFNYNYCIIAGEGHSFGITSQKHSILSVCSCSEWNEHCLPILSWPGEVFAWQEKYRLEKVNSNDPPERTKNR
jgi:hypothetical protein